MARGLAARDAWAARRALFEGAETSAELLAAACRISPAGLAARIAGEGWTSPSQRTEQGLDVADRLSALRRKGLERLERLSIWNEPMEGAPEKASISELSTLLRTLEKLEEDTRDGERAKENQTQNDAQIADILGRLDRKIVELAHHLAEAMVAADAERRGALAHTR